MTIPEKYMPLDDWVYMKIYTGYRTADNILTKVLYPAWISANKRGSAEKWFFIRYSDPDFHLRYRIKISDHSDRSEIMRNIIEELYPYTESGTVWKIDVSTYFPEIKRYGKNILDIVEHIFSADSRAVMEYLITTGTKQDSRWLFALASIDQFLDDFGYDLFHKKEILLDLSRSFGIEFGKNAGLAKQLSGKYRNYRNLISEQLSDTNTILLQRSEKVQKAVEQINTCHDDGRLEVDRDDLVSSIIHMSLNRIFQAQNRIFEMVLYDFLFRYYKSRSYQEKNNYLQPFEKNVVIDSKHKH